MFLFVLLTFGIGAALEALSEAESEERNVLLVARGSPRIAWFAGGAAIAIAFCFLIAQY